MKKSFISFLILIHSMAFALADGITVQEADQLHGLQYSDFTWERGDLFKDICHGQVTFTNTSNRALGNIHYRTYYVSETGVTHQNSLIDAVIEKRIEPGQTRTIGLQHFLVPTDCALAGIIIISAETL